jgi:hypothetical protein
MQLEDNKLLGMLKDIVLDETTVKDVREWVVIKRLNHVQKGKRIIGIDMRRKCLTNSDPCTVLNQDTGTQRTSLKKMFPLDKIKLVQPFRYQGQKSLAVRISFNLEKQPDYELEFENREDKDSFLSCLSYSIRRVKKTGSNMDLLKPESRSNRAEDEGDACFECNVLVCDRTGAILYELPGFDEMSSKTWAKGMFTISNTLQVSYIVDEIGHLVESGPKRMGQLVVNETNVEKSCLVWRRNHLQKSTESDSAEPIIIQQSGCMLVIINPSGTLKKLYITCETNKDALAIQATILKAMSAYLDAFGLATANGKNAEGVVSDNLKRNTSQKIPPVLEGVLASAQHAHADVC